MSDAWTEKVESARTYIGKWRVIRTSRGELRWHNERWGVVIQETIYSGGPGLLDFSLEPPRTLPEVRLPWEAVIQMVEESPEDV